MRSTCPVGMLTRTIWPPGQPSGLGQFPKPTPSLRSVSPPSWLAERYSGSSVIDTLVCWCPGTDAQGSGGLCAWPHCTDRRNILSHSAVDYVWGIWNGRHWHLSYQMNGLAISNPLDGPDIDLSRASLKRLFTTV